MTLLLYNHFYNGIPYIKNCLLLGVMKKLIPVVPLFDLGDYIEDTY